MARRRRRSRRRSSGLGGVSSMVRQLGMGMVGSMAVSSVAAKFVPQYAGIAGLAGSYLLGGPVGLVGSVLVSGIPSLGGSTTDNF